METYKRICIKDWAIEAENGDRQELKRGKEYITSVPRKDDSVIVFSTFWVSAPLDIFAGEVRFTR